MTDLPPPGGQSDPPGPGWWQASDGNWYPPEQRPGIPPPPAYGVPSYGHYPHMVPKSTNGFAIASLITSVVSCGLGSILGIIFGHIALRQIGRTGEDGRGLAIAGLVLGYAVVVVAVLAILAIVLLGDSGSVQFGEIEGQR